MRLGSYAVAADDLQRILDLLGPPPYERSVHRLDIFSGRTLSASVHYHRVLARAAHAWALAGDHGRAIDAALVASGRLDDEIGGSMLLADIYMHAGLPDEAEVLYNRRQRTHSIQSGCPHPPRHPFDRLPVLYPLYLSRHPLGGISSWPTQYPGGRGWPCAAPLNRAGDFALPRTVKRSIGHVQV